MGMVALGPASLEIGFERSAGRLHPRSLFGLLCGPDGRDAGAGIWRSPGTLRTIDRTIDGEDFALLDSTAAERTICGRWRSDAAQVELLSTWDLQEGVLCRTDVLRNASDRPVTILRYLSRIPLQQGNYQAYVQSGRWACENQGRWIPLHAGTLTLTDVAGRTAQGCTPYACLRDQDSGRGWAMDLLPCGNWVMHLRLIPTGHGMAGLSLEWGQADDGLQLTLAPAESWQSPPLLIAPLLDGSPASAAPRMHRLSLSRWFGDAKPRPPVVYNTWLDVFDNLEVPRLRAQLSAARETGCESFVIDAGWFGRGHGDWFDSTGHWHENTEAAFRGRMREFADEVRSAGLGFGLWMEPEHVGPKAPVRSEHPDWFVGADAAGAGPRLDLENPDAYRWLRSEIGRLIETYELAWMKLDFNIELGRDQRGWELYRYYQAWFGMLDDVRRSYPSTWIEGCASGGMRLDLNALRHHDSHFMTDNANAYDQLRIGEGVLLRLPPGRVERWLVLRSIGRSVPDYPGSLADAPESFVTPPAAGWQPVQAAETVDLDFAALSCMPGTLALSGDPAGLSDAARQRLRGHVGFWKQWRQFIAASHAHLLTEPRSLADRSGWSAIQMSCAQRDEQLVFTYRLQDNRARRLFALRELDAERTYRITRYPAEPASERTDVDGRQLMAGGLDAHCPRPGSAACYVIRPAD